MDISKPLGYDHFYEFRRGFPVDSATKNLPEMQDMQETLFPSWVEESLEGEMATHSSILAWRSPMDGGAWWATVHGVPKSESHTAETPEPCT